MKLKLLTTTRRGIEEDFNNFARDKIIHDVKVIYDDGRFDLVILYREKAIWDMFNNNTIKAKMGVK